MTKVGDKLVWDRPMVVDKHCIGGVPGNRTLHKPRSPVRLLIQINEKAARPHYDPR